MNSGMLFIFTVVTMYHKSLMHVRSKLSPYKSSINFTIFAITNFCKNSHGPLSCREYDLVKSLLFRHSTVADVGNIHVGMDPACPSICLSMYHVWFLRNGFVGISSCFTSLVGICHCLYEHQVWPASFQIFDNEEMADWRPFYWKHVLT